MKRKLLRFWALALVLELCAVPARAYTELIPGGQVIGLEIASGSVTVAAFDDVLGACARDAGMQIGDRILSVDGVNVASAEELRRALCCSDGQVELRLWRSGEEQSVRVRPTVTSDGPRLGVMIREGMTGIGTVTWYDPETGRFGTLGHGIGTGKGELLPMTGGCAYAAEVQSVQRGRVGEPGQLRGALTEPGRLGELSANTEQGVFGSVTIPFGGEPLPVAERDQVHTGSAAIRSTVAGQTVGDFGVEILRIYSESREDGRDLLLKVTDPALLETTGGIVQGMSGSPIIQDGRLVGAVTHVLVNDPTMGYGIFIGNMLSAA